ncbi:MAG: hypothetical protein AAGK17_11655 [Pseudomonadota bacterium]
MRFPKSFLCFAILALWGSPASAQSSFESWLNGFAMELGKTRANYTAIVQNVDCCAPDRRQVEETWNKVNATLAGTLEFSRRKHVGIVFCKSTHLLGLQVNLTSLHIRLLARETRRAANLDAANTDNASKLERIAADVQRLDQSVKAYHSRIGCPKPE